MTRVDVVMVMSVENDHQPVTSEENDGILSDEWHECVPRGDYRGRSPDRSCMDQSLDLVGDKATSPPVPPVPLQALLDLDLQTKVFSSDVEDDSPSGKSSSMTSAAAFLAAAATLGLSILM